MYLVVALDQSIEVAKNRDLTPPRPQFNRPRRVEGGLLLNALQLASRSAGGYT